MGDNMDTFKLLNTNSINNNDYIKIKQPSELQNNQSSTDNKETSKSNDKIDKIYKRDLQDAVDKANKVFNESTHLRFEIHDKTKDVMVKIINDETGEVLKEIPPKKLLDMVAKMWEIAGVLIDEKR